ncbi:MAG: MoaD/ThiS family protein [Pseudomonadota bacterium]
MTVIRVKGFFTFKMLLGGPGELTLEMDKPTPRKIMRELSARFGREMSPESFFPGGDRPAAPGPVMLINGRHLRHFPEGPDLPLTAGDFVTLFPPVAGG